MEPGGGAQRRDTGARTSVAPGLRRHGSFAPTRTGPLASPRFLSEEVKWRAQLRPSDLKQIAKYDRGRIVARTESMHEISGVPVVPLPRALALLGKGVWPPPESSV